MSDDPPTSLTQAEPDLDAILSALDKGDQSAVPHALALSLRRDKRKDDMGISLFGAKVRIGSKAAVVFMGSLKWIILFLLAFECVAVLATGHPFSLKSLWQGPAYQYRLTGTNTMERVP